MLLGWKRFDVWKCLINATTVAAFLFLVIGFGGAVWHASNSPHAPINQTASNQQTEKRTSESPKESAEQAIARYNYWLTIFTAVLASATVILGLATIGLYFAGERQLQHVRSEAQRARRQRWEDRIALSDQIAIARDTADAAKKTADAAVAAERARLFANITHNFLACIEAASNWEGSGVSDQAQIAASNYPIARIRFRNYGRTPAILNTVSIGSEYVDGNGMPSFVYDEKVVRETIIGPRQSSEEFSTVIVNITFEMARKVRDGGGTLWLYGGASYEDVFGVTQTHRFLARLVPIRPRERYVLQSYDYQHYNRST